MPRGSFRRLFHSAFTQLLVITLAAGLAVTLTVLVGFASFRFHSLSHLDRNLLLYTQYLLRDLGDPPDSDAAARIARETGMVIRFDHPGRSWQTPPGDADLVLDRAWMRRHDNGIWSGHHRGHYFIRLDHGGGELTFISPRKIKRLENAGWVLALMAGALLIILGAAYFFIRRVLAPLRPLEAGVRALTAGRLDHRVSETGAGEFQDLAGAFNTMARRLSRLLASKEHLLLDMSHELRSPLTRLKVQLEFVADAEMRDALSADVAEMEAMVSAILEEARLRSSAAALDLQSIDLADLIRSVADDFADRPPGLVYQAGPSVVVRVDADKMRMVLRNLLDNAYKHTPEGADPVVVSHSSGAQGVRIVVKDQGEGIPDTAMPHLFEPFFRADASRSRRTGGYGLGLSLCKAVIDAHDGRIDITSTAGRGTRVVITLPAPQLPVSARPAIPAGRPR
jgi:signal transduction histidine kinase